MSKIKFSLIASTILVVSSFMPILQILILYLNSVIAQPIGALFSKNDNVGIYVVNSVLTVVLLILFFFARTTLQKVLAVVGVIVFFLPLFMYSTGDVINTDKFYFLQFLIAGVVVSIILVGIEYFKPKLPK
jgi:hypothetical protein